MIRPVTGSPFEVEINTLGLTVTQPRAPNGVALQYYRPKLKVFKRGGRVKPIPFWSLLKMKTLLKNKCPPRDC